MSASEGGGIENVRAVGAGDVPTCSSSAIATATTAFIAASTLVPPGASPPPPTHPPSPSPSPSSSPWGQVDKCTRTRQRVYRDTKMMDTTAIAGTSGFYFQRLPSHQLHDLLTRQYFEKLLHTITNRAELLATERK